ncbi:MAG: hypothetical protein AAB074_07395 [Planctomycetota bacterium]
MNASADDPPILRGGCVHRARMRWFEKLVVAAYRQGATVIRARAGQRFAFRFGGETRTIGTHPVREEDLLDRLGELLPKSLARFLRVGGQVAFEYVIVPWAPAHAHIFHGVRGLVMGVRLGGDGEGVPQRATPPASRKPVPGEEETQLSKLVQPSIPPDSGEPNLPIAPVFGEGEIEIRPSERDIDRILRAAFTAGASQVLIKPRAPLALKIGAGFVRPGAHGLSADFVEKLLGEILTAEERFLLLPDAELQVEIGVCPFATCAAEIFLGGGEPSLLIRLPGTELTREEPPAAPPAEALRQPPPSLTVEGCRREIRDCIQQCALLHDRRVAESAAARQKRPVAGEDSRELRLDYVKWLESRRRSRRLIDRLRAVVSSTERETSLEMVRAILRESVGIHIEMKDLKPPLPETPTAAPALDRGFPATGFPLLNAGFVLGASELLLFEGEVPTYFISGEPKRPSSAQIARKELEALLGLWETGPEYDAGEVPVADVFRLKFTNGDVVRVLVKRQDDRLEVTVVFLKRGGGAESAGVGALLPKNPPRPFLRALPPDSGNQNPPLPA